MKLYRWNGDVGYRYRDDSGSLVGITIGSVKQDLDSSAGDDITVEMTTLGGNFFEAAPIMDLLKGYKGKKTLILSGIVASAGTVIALGFDRVISRPTSMFMIHNAQGVSFGDHNQMAKDAELQRRMSKMIAEEYAKRTKRKEEEIQEWMDAETWFMGEEIVTNGFADEMESSETTLKASPMMLLTAQRQFMDRKTLWARNVPETLADARATVEAMIDACAVDKSTDWNKAEDDAALKVEKYPYGKDGKVFRSALRRMASVASNDKNPELATWAGAMLKKIDAKGAEQVNEEDIVAFLKDKPAVAERVLKASGHTNMIVSPAHAAALELKAKLDAEKIADPVAEIKSLKASLEAVETDRVSNALTAHFGPVKLEHNGMTNDLRAYAEVKLAGVKSADLPAKIEEFKKDSIALKLASDRMDVNSAQNVFGVVELRADQKNKPVATYDGVPVVTV